MAKAIKNETTLEVRAWELFAHNVLVGGTPSVSHDELARQCFEAAAIFELVASDIDHKEPSKG